MRQLERKRRAHIEAKRLRHARASGHPGLYLRMFPLSLAFAGMTAVVGMDSRFRGNDGFPRFPSLSPAFGGLPPRFREGRLAEAGGQARA
jgi:hypothetical protein